jgi:hypothetical protein
MPDWITQVGDLIRYHLPAGEAASLWPAVAAIAAGIVLCVAGAKLVRMAVVLGFAGAGAMLGAEAAEQFSVSAIGGIVAGIIVAVVVGYVLFRLWVAILAGLVAVAVAACIAVGPSVPSLLQEYDDARIAGGATGDGFALLTPQQQQASQRAGAWEYCRGFAAHVRSRYPGDTRRMAVILAAAFLAGAAFGLFAHRWAIVLGTVTLGTMLILAGTVPLISRYYPYALERCMQRPTELLIGLGAWLFLVVAVQRRGLRPAVALAAPPAQASPAS